MFFLDLSESLPHSADISYSLDAYKRQNMSDRSKDENDKILKAYEHAFTISSEYVEPYWELAVRLYKLWRGVLPTELESTYTQVNLNLAHSAIQERIPKHLSTVFSTPKLVSLNARRPVQELYVTEAEAWLRDFLTNKMNMRYSIFPTIQSVEIFGTGYRRAGIYHDKQGKPQIVTRHADFFQVLPAPNGGLVNPPDIETEDAVDWDFFIDWTTEKRAKELAEKGIYDKTEVKRMIDARAEEGNWIDNRYRDQFSNTVGGIVYDGPSSWRSKMMGNKDLKQRRRIVFWERRDRVTIVAEDKYVLYDGPPKVLPGYIPTIKYTAVRDQTNWFGIGALEMIEDSLLAAMLNSNLRLQHLIQTMFPIKWIRQDIAGMHPRSTWDLEPGQTIEFPEGVDDITKALFYDRAQDAPQQAFLEDSYLKQIIQDVGGMPDYSKGMASDSALGNGTATGITSLIAQANARFFMEAEQIEYGGLREECRMALRLAEKYISEPTEIRNPASEDGFPWNKVDPSILTSDFEVVTHGTAYLSNRSETVQKMLAFMPMLLQNADIINRPELLRQATDVIDIFPEPDKILLPTEAMPSLNPAGQENTPGIGGMASPLDMNQKTRSTSNRNTVEAESGRTVPAGFSV